MSGGDFKSKSEAALCARRRIDDRIEVVRDLQRVVTHLGAIVAADQLGLASGDIDRIVARDKEITGALLVAMYGTGGARLLPSLVPREPIDAQVDKIMAACGARAPLDKLGVSGSVSVARAMAFDMATSPKPPSPRPNAGPRDRDAHERQILAEVGTTRAALVAILRRVRDAAGDWPRAGVELGLAASTAKNLVGGHSKFSRRVADLLLDWDKANPVTGADAVHALNSVGHSADRGAVPEAPPTEPIEQNSTPAPPAASLPPGDAADDRRAGVEGAAVSPPFTPPPTIPTPANDDPFAVALTALVTARDAAREARIAIRAEVQALDAQIAPLDDRRRQLERDESALINRLNTLAASVERLQAVAK